MAEQSPAGSPKRIHFLQHVPFEGLGSIEGWIARRGHALSTTRFFEPEPVWPDLEGVDWLIVMGGPMNVDEESVYPWLGPEKAFIARALRAGKVLLGICLGAQLIAAALGARVRPNPCKEIGWLPVRLSPQVRRHPLLTGFPGQWVTFHWHGDTFDLPEGALHLAASAGCLNQGFLLDDRVVGLQFHPEMTPQGVAALVQQCAAELSQAPHIQSAERLLDPLAPFAANQQLMQMLLDRLEALAGA